MAHRAKLDADGIYMGVEEVLELGLADLAVPPDCDLKPGAYKAVRDDEGRAIRVDPLPPHLQRRGGVVIDVERALYEYLKGEHGAGAALPQLTLDWCVNWETSFDSVTAGGVDAPDGRGAHDYFRVSLGILKARS